MQLVSDEFTNLAKADVRPLSWKVSMSFDKAFDDDIDFFTIQTSLIGGGDFIPGSGDVVQEWDKYLYTDYSDRVLSIEWERGEEPFASMTMGMADVVFNNTDDFFTPDGDSEISDSILPYRPIRIYAGFGDELIPVFVGLTQGMPKIDERAKAASFHCIDFMSAIYDRPLTESVLYEDIKTDEILSALFQLAGLSESQLSLDTGMNLIPITSFPKDKRLGDAVSELLVAEQGRVYMDEQGIITFKNRANYDDTVKYTFTPHININDYQVRKEDDIINVVEVKSQVVEKQSKQEYWELSESVKVPAGESVTVWAEFENPVDNTDDPIYIDTATTSSFEVNTSPDGSGTANSTDVTLSSSSELGDTFKMIFANSGSQDLYITSIKLFTEPIIPTRSIYVREQDNTSVGKYDECVLTIESKFIQTETDAQSLALTALNDYADMERISSLNVKGSMAFQIGDTIEINLYGVISEAKIIRIKNGIGMPANFRQILYVKPFTRTPFFTIEESLIGGTDQIRP